MDYIVGLIGLVAGFVLGQIVLMVMLRDLPNEALLDNPKRHWKYAMLNWAFAIAGMASAIYLYDEIFNS